MRKARCAPNGASIRRRPSLVLARNLSDVPATVRCSALRPEGHRGGAGQKCPGGLTATARSSTRGIEVGPLAVNRWSTNICQARTELSLPGRCGAAESPTNTAVRSAVDANARRVFRRRHHHGVSHDARPPRPPRRWSAAAEPSGMPLRPDRSPSAAPARRQQLVSPPEQDPRRLAIVWSAVGRSRRTDRGRTASADRRFGADRMPDQRLLPRNGSSDWLPVRPPSWPPQWALPA